MTRMTRRRALQEESPSTVSATPNESPIFSNRTSVRSETPLTSDLDEDDAEELDTNSQLKTSIANKKRRGQSEDESETAGQAVRPSPKRRIVSRMSFVEIPVHNTFRRETRSMVCYVKV